MLIAVVRGALPWPLFGLTDEHGRAVRYACVQGPARTPAEARALRAAVRAADLIGFTSYVAFPAGTTPAEDFDYRAVCRAWCHCFRDPDAYLPSGRPHVLLSHSDFTDYALISQEGLFPDDDGGKDFDFTYVCPAGPWSERAKNWELALRCLPVLCRDLGLKGMLVGRAPGSEFPDCGDRLAACAELPWRELMRVFLRSRFLFLPNRLDASPRIITEALSMGTPILVNRHILGGWKYVNPFTGAFFESERDVAAGARRCLENWTSPRRWFIANHGPMVAGRMLSRFVAGFDPAMRRVGMLRITYTPAWIPALEQ